MRGVSYRLGVLGLLINIHFANAQQMQGNFNPAQGTSVLTNDIQSRPANSFGHIRIEGMQYLTPLQENPDLTFTQLLSARLTTVKKASYVEAGLDLSGGTFFSTDQSTFCRARGLCFDVWSL